MNEKTRFEGYKSTCKLCNSKHLEKAHKLKREGKTLEQIKNILNEKGENLSLAGVGRHFQHVQEVVHQTAEEIQKIVEHESTDIATHRKWTNEILEKVYVQLRDSLDSGTMQLSIQDFAKLLQLRHLVMEGDTSAGNDIIKLFEKAQQKYDFKDNQPQLFDKAIDVSTSEVEREAR